LTVAVSGRRAWAGGAGLAGRGGTPDRRSGHQPFFPPQVRGWVLAFRRGAPGQGGGRAGLVRIIKRKLKKIQYRPHLINGCLAATGLRIEPW